MYPKPAVGFIQHYRPLALALALAALLAGCSVSSQPSGLDSRDGGATAAPVPTAGLPKVEDLAAIDRLRPVSDVDYDLFNYGGAIAPLTARRNVTQTGLFGFQAAYAPVAGTSTTLGDAAFAIYNFHPVGLGGGTVLSLDWNTPPADGTLWVALADPQQFAWRWFGVPASGEISFNPASYTWQSGGYLYLMVFVEGNQTCTLNSITLGDPGLTAVLDVDEAGAGANFVHNFDASGSFSVSGTTITNFEWDWDADGVYDESTGGTGTNAHQYSETGVHWPTVRVTASGGQTDSASIPIFTYDEQEENDNNVAADAMPALPFLDWAGNCGNGPFIGGGAYDGDALDILSFSAAQGDSLHFSLQTFGESNQYLGLFDSDGDHLTMDSYSNSSSQELNYTIQAGDNAPFYLHINSDPNHGGSANYLLSGTKNSLPQALLQAAVQVDNFPYQYIFTVSNSVDADGSIAKYEMDFESDGIWDAFNSDGSQFEYTFSDAWRDFQQVTLRVTDDDGNTDTDTFTLKLANSSDEIEDNDGPLSATNVDSENKVQGSIGENSYDGDNVDWWQFNPIPESLVTVQLEFTRNIESGFFGSAFSTMENDIAMNIYDADGDNLLSVVSNGTPFLTTTYALTAADALPLRVELLCIDGGSNYELTFAQNTPPSIVLAADKFAVNAGDSINFDASGTSDLGTLGLSYSWDFDGDGSYDSSDGPLTSSTLDTDGVYIGNVRVTDGDGLVSYKSFVIRVGAVPGIFDEVEDNDAVNMSQVLPADSVVNFSGNIGTTGDVNADKWDFFNIGSPVEGTTISIRLHFIVTHDDLDLHLYDNLGNQLAVSSAGISDYEVINYTLGKFVELPLHIGVENFSDAGSTDYLLSAVY